MMIVHLDTPKEIRWNDVAKRAGPSTVAALNAFYKTVSWTWPFCKTLSVDERDEIAGYALALGVATEVLVAFNLAFDVNMDSPSTPLLFSQTASIVETPFARHDYTINYPAALAPLVVDLTFVKNGVRVETRSFLGLIGITTAALSFFGADARTASVNAPDRTFSVTVNARRPLVSPHFAVKCADRLFNAAPRPVGLIVRDAMFLRPKEAIDLLFTVECAPCFLLVAAPRESCAITKGTYTIKKWHKMLCQTNHDIGSPPFPTKDPAMLSSRIRLVNRTAYMLGTTKKPLRPEGTFFEVCMDAEHATLS